MNTKTIKPHLRNLFIPSLLGALFLAATPIMVKAEQVTHSYDNLNRLIKSDYGNGNVIDYAYDANGNRTSQKVTTAAVLNQPPTANAGSDQTVRQSSLVTLNGSASTDPDNAPSPLTFSWAQKSGPSVALAGASTASPTFTPTTIGTYIFTLTVSDGLASASDEVKIDVVSNQFTFKATQLLLGKKHKSFFLLSNFTLGTGSNGINPVKDAVTFKIGNFTTTIPAGSFRKFSPALFGYEGTINKVKLEATIKSLGNNRYTFQTEGAGVNFSGVTNPVKVDLSIGDDNGTTSVNAVIK
jgi:YD repeat-containing protein